MSHSQTPVRDSRVDNRETQKYIWFGGPKREIQKTGSIEIVKGENSKGIKNLEYM